MSAGKETTYPPTFKEEAVRLYLEGGRSYQQLANELGLKDKKRSVPGSPKYNVANPWRMVAASRIALAKGGLALSSTPWKKNLLM